jgi:hypothetical protein
MSNTRSHELPKARTEKLIIKELPDETLVYDLETDRAHCLNSTAGWVWKKCDGNTTVSELTALLASETNSAGDESLIWLALDQLERFNLLSTSPLLPDAFAGISRRQWVKRIGMAAIAIPVIISISAPDAHAQGSCPAPPAKQPNGCPCNGNGNCLSGNCIANICQP